jgi:phage shock protein E
MKRLVWLILAMIMALMVFPSLACTAGDDPAKPLVIDVRTEAEWQVEHLEGAILIPYDKIADSIATIAPDKTTKIALYCRSGRRSGIALETLKKLGYLDVGNYGSVKDAAQKLKLPIVTGAK